MQVSVSARQIAMGTVCACCGGDTDGKIEASASRSRGKRVVRTETSTWRFPCCPRCQEHVARWHGAGSWAGVVFALGLGVGLPVAFTASGPVGAGILVAGIVGALLIGSALRGAARGSCSPTCAAPQRPVEYLGWNGTVRTFEFTSSSYASLFMLANQTKLVNVDGRARAALAHAEATLADERRKELAAIEAREVEVRGKLEAVRAQKKATADEAKQVEAFAKAVARLEAAKGPAGRRSALEAGLRSVISATDQERLKLEASKIEVQAALDKADDLKSPAAKRRTLEAALQALREDGVADDLQVQQIAWLEAALAELSAERTT